jgi:hypothetical protein
VLGNIGDEGSLVGEDGSPGFDGFYINSRGFASSKVDWEGGSELSNCCNRADIISIFEIGESSLNEFE